MARFESGHLPDADEELRSILASGPSSRRVEATWPMLITVLRQQGRLDDAITECRKLLDSTRRKSWRRMLRSYYDRTLLLADLLTERGDLAGAIAEYSELLVQLNGRKVAYDQHTIVNDFKDDPSAHLMRRLATKGDELAIEVRQRIAALQEQRGPILLSLETAANEIGGLAGDS